MTNESYTSTDYGASTRSQGWRRPSQSVGNGSPSRSWLHDAERQSIDQAEAQRRQRRANLSQSAASYDRGRRNAGGNWAAPATAHHIGETSKLQTVVSDAILRRRNVQRDELFVLRCPKKFKSRSGRSRHCVTAHECWITRDGRLQEISLKQVSAARKTVRGESGGHRSRRHQRPPMGVTIVSPPSVADPGTSPSSHGRSDPSPPIDLTGRRADMDAEFVLYALAISVEERAAFSTDWFSSP